MKTQARVLEVYLFIGFIIFLTFSLYKARMEVEYCKVTGNTISFERVFWSQVSCRRTAWR
jgi:hypothetical protein